MQHSQNRYATPLGTAMQLTPRAGALYALITPLALGAGDRNADVVQWDEGVGKRIETVGVNWTMRTAQSTL